MKPDFLAIWWLSCWLFVASRPTWHVDMLTWFCYWILKTTPDYWKVVSTLLKCLLKSTGVSILLKCLLKGWQVMYAASGHNSYWCQSLYTTLQLHVRELWHGKQQSVLFRIPAFCYPFCLDKKVQFLLKINYPSASSSSLLSFTWNLVWLILAMISTV